MLRSKNGKNKHIIVSPITDGWKVTHNNQEKIYRTKQTAVKAAKLSAKLESSPLIVLTQNGNIDSVNPYITSNSRKNKLLIAKGSRKISNRTVRESIAKVMIKRKTNLDSNE